MLPARALLPDGRRWHFQQGPIDLVLEAWGDRDECARAYAQAWVRFETVLAELVRELPLLRKPVPAPSLSRASGREGAHPPRLRRMGSEGTAPTAGFESADAPFPHLPDAPSGAPGPLLSRCAGEEIECLLEGKVARRMWRACAPLASVFITPMAAVAGAVADEILAAMISGRDLRKAYVNNGGDIALHLAPGERFETGIVGDPAKPKIAAAATVKAEDPVRGIATSGWRGRSFSRGIADAATVLAQDAASADAAATLVANAVDIAHPAILRRAACELDPDSDLGEHLVTVEVGRLDARSVKSAMERGHAAAQALRQRGRLEAAFIELAGARIAVGASGAKRESAPADLAWSLRA